MESIKPVVVAKCEFVIRNVLQLLAFLGILNNFDSDAVQTKQLLPDWMVRMILKTVDLGF